MDNDRILALRAIKIANEGIGQGCGPFGAVIAKNGVVIAEASNSVTLDHDPTAHAEVAAIRKAAKALKTHNLDGCTLYCSCEPCPMCFGAIYWAGISQVIYVCDRHDAAQAGFSDKIIYDEIILDNEKRSIAFRQITGLNGKEVFGTWKENESKIPY